MPQGSKTPKQKEGGNKTLSKKHVKRQQNAARTADGGGSGERRVRKEREKGVSIEDGRADTVALEATQRHEKNESEVVMDEAESSAMVVAVDNDLLVLQRNAIGSTDDLKRSLSVIGNAEFEIYAERMQDQNITTTMFPELQIQDLRAMGFTIGHAIEFCQYHQTPCAPYTPSDNRILKQLSSSISRSRSDSVLSMNESTMSELAYEPQLPANANANRYIPRTVGTPEHLGVKEEDEEDEEEFLPTINKYIALDPNVVTVNFQMRKLIEIELLEHKFSIEFTCDVQWRDLSRRLCEDANLIKRRKHNNYPAELWEEMFPYKETGMWNHQRDPHWTPRLTFANAADENYKVDDKWVHLSKHNNKIWKVNYRTKGNATFNEYFELHSFPFDAQDLQIVIQTAHEEVSGNCKHRMSIFDLRVIGDLKMPDVLRKDEYKVVDWVIRKCFSDPFNSKSYKKYKEIHICYKVERLSGWVVSNILIPVCIFGNVSLCVLLIPIQSLDGRLGALFALLQAETTFLEQMRALCPRCNYWTTLDKFCYINTLLILAVSFFATFFKYLCPDLVAEENGKRMTFFSTMTSFSSRDADFEFCLWLNSAEDHFGFALFSIMFIIEFAWLISRRTLDPIAARSAPSLSVFSLWWWLTLPIRVLFDSRSYGFMSDPTMLEKENPSMYTYRSDSIKKQVGKLLKPKEETVTEEEFVEFCSREYSKEMKEWKLLEYHMKDEDDSSIESRKKRYKVIYSQIVNGKQNKSATKIDLETYFFANEGILLPCNKKLGIKAAIIFFVEILFARYGIEFLLSVFWNTRFEIGLQVDGIAWASGANYIASLVGRASNAIQELGRLIYSLQEGSKVIFLSLISVPLACFLAFLLRRNSKETPKSHNKGRHKKRGKAKLRKPDN